MFNAYLKPTTDFEIVGQLKSISDLHASTLAYALPSNTSLQIIILFCIYSEINTCVWSKYAFTGTQYLLKYVLLINVL